MIKLKKITFKKNDLKNQSQLMLTFKTHDHGHEPRTNLIEGKPYSEAKFSINKILRDEIKKKQTKTMIQKNKYQ